MKTTQQQRAPDRPKSGLQVTLALRIEEFNTYGKDV
jgi:hypothetical protein